MLGDVERRPRKVAVGEFDGVHLGHREVIAGTDTVLTFEPHPLQVVRPEAAPRLLTSFDAKAELIAELGVRELVVIPFDEGFAAPEPAGVHRPGAGRRARRHAGYRWARTSGSAIAPPGDPALLAADPRFETRVVALVELDGEIVSSSHIRALVQAGEVEAAGRMLGAPFQMRGEVVRGRSARPGARLPDRQHRSRRGARVPRTRRLRRLAPTAFAPPSTSACARRSGPVARVLVEAYLLDRDVDLYGQHAPRRVPRRLRGERRFESVEALVEQMRRDVERTRELC